MQHQGLKVIEFKNKEELSAWLRQNYRNAEGVWVRLYKLDSGYESVTFHEMLEEGL